MTIALRAAGTPTGATTATTAVNPSTPSDCQAGDLAVLTVSMKPYSTTITTPSGWTKVGEATNGTVATGTDVGSTKVAVFVQQNPKGSTAVGNLSFTGANSCAAVINVYSKADSATWNIDSPTYTSGGDSTNGTNYSATGSAGLSVASGDWVIASSAINSDLGTISAEAIGGMSGATIGTTVERTNRDVTTGNDSNLLVVDAPITAGSSSAAPTLTYTNASSTSGTTLFLRLREESARTVLNTTNLTDAFSSISGSWTATHATAVSNQAKLAAGAGYDFAALVHTSRWDFTAGEVILEVPTFTATAPGGSDQRLFVLRLFDGALASTSPYNYFDIRMESNAAAVATIRGVSGTAGTGTAYGEVTYSSSTHRWIRMAESSGVIHFYASADGYNWTEFGAGFTPEWSVKDMVLRIEATGSIAHDVFIDNLNLPTTPAITQAAYRWYADGTESGSTALAAQDTSYTANASTSDVNLLLRVRLQSSNANPITSTDDFRLQYEKNASGTWVDVQAAVAEALLDTYDSSNVDSAYLFTLSGYSAYAQSFIGDDNYLTKVSFWLRKFGTGQNASSSLWAHSGTYGTSSVPPISASALATSDSVSAASISTTYGWIDFTFSNPVRLTNGTPYCISIASPNHDTNFLTAGIDISSPTHGGNSSRLTSGWAPQSGDMAFRVYTGVLVSNVYIFDSSNLTDGAATTNRLTGGTGSFTAGKVSEDGLADDVGWAGNDFTELLYAITLEADDLADADTLKFRIVQNGATTYMTYSSYPQITIGAGFTDHEATAASTITATPTVASEVPRDASAASTVTSTQSAEASLTHTASAASTITASTTAEATVTKTVEAASTLTQTPAATANADYQASATTTLTQSPTASATGDFSATATSTITQSPAASATVDKFVSAASTLTQSPTAAITSNFSAEAASTLTQTATASADVIKQAAAASTITQSPTATATADYPAAAASTITQSPTASADAAKTVSATSTLTQTATASADTTKTVETAATLTQSPTASADVTKTVTAASTITQSPTADATAAKTVTGTSTVTQSPAATATAGFSATAASTITQTATASADVTKTVSATSTITQSPTAEATATKTVEATSTLTQSPTASATADYAAEATSTITATGVAAHDGAQVATATSTLTASTTADTLVTHPTGATSTITQSPTASATISTTAAAASTVTATTLSNSTAAHPAEATSTVTATTAAAATAAKTVSATSTVTATTTADADVISGNVDHEAEAVSTLVATAEAIVQAAYLLQAASTIAATTTATLTVPIPPSDNGWEDTVTLGPGGATATSGTGPGRVLVGSGAGSVHAGTPSTLTVRVGS